MTRRLPLVLTALLLAGSRVLAQDGAEQPTPAPMQPMLAALSRTFSVEFPGGTVEAYLSSIRTAFPGANIIGANGLDQFSVPAISLKEVNILGALQPLHQVVTSNNPDQDIHVWFENGVAAVSVVDNSHAGQSIFAKEEAPDEPQIVTRIWNITALTTGGGMTIADITGAIETAVSIASDAKPEFRMHEPTGTLVVKGLDTQLDIIDEVIGKLQESAGELDDLRSRMANLRGDIAMCQARVANYERQLTEREKQAAAATDEDERNHRTEEALELQAELEEARARLSDYQLRLAELESRVKKPNP